MKTKIYTPIANLEVSYDVDSRLIAISREYRHDLGNIEAVAPYGKDIQVMDNDFDMITLFGHFLNDVEISLEVGNDFDRYWSDYGDPDTKDADFERFKEIRNCRHVFLNILPRHTEYNKFVKELKNCVDSIVSTINGMLTNDI